MRITLLFFITVLLSGCYSFKGISIPEDVNSYFIYDVQSNSSEAPVFLTQVFYQAFRDKIRAETKLRYNETTPDIEINATVEAYNITYVAPQPGQNVASNRLTVGLKVEYTDNKDDKRSWTSTFRRFADYSANANLLDIQDQLISQISEEIMEDFFNKAFGDW
jgi:hypothetical protein